MNKVIIIVPCYNEALSIAGVVDQINALGYEYCIIDDGSTDNTLQVLNVMNANVISHKTNKGQGAALRTGFKYALEKHYDELVHFDADGQHDINDVSLLLNKLRSENLDIVFGSRFLNKHSRTVPLLKRVVLRLARYFEYLRTGILLSDAHCGLRVLKVETCKRMDLQANRMAHASEILSETKRLKLNYGEVAVHISYNVLKKQESNFRRMISVMIELFLLPKK